ncbi:glycosyltransferase family 1 protein [Flammeovirga sp. SubArs3]|uniref:glycosyltransferase family 4 protein n=1 Tax=Flammeovirga sp. SubArs3 TaxID=2995316 RepID=UPI00248BCF5E|nr:glycosyltransferase family 1 protein [Flammeovirga sp. SubArs3]
MNLIFRKKSNSAFSIEELFQKLTISINYSEINTVELPYNGASIKAIILNFLFCLKFKNTLNHVTGDIHYIIPALGKKTILTIHDVYSIIKGNFIKKTLIKIFWFWIPSLYVKKITVISEFTKKEVLEIIPWAQEKIIVIPNPIDLELCRSNFIKKKKTFTLLIIGTKENKNIERIFESVKELDLEINLIGKLSDNQQKLVNSLKLNINNFYNLPYNKVLELYNTSNLLCFPSTYEGFGMPILEAQAIGIPVITSNLSPMKDITGEGALLVDPYSIKNIRECIIKIINSPMLQEELIIKGKENVLRYDIHAIAKQYENLYKEIENV